MITYKEILILFIQCYPKNLVGIKGPIEVDISQKQSKPNQIKV